jgi:hypothetical protein
MKKIFAEQEKQFAIRQVEREKQLEEMQQAAQHRQEAAQHRQEVAMHRQQAAMQRQQAALSDHEIELKKEFAVGSSPSLSISNEFGNIRIIEGGNDKIVFNIKITGKGVNQDDAKKHAESVDVNFKQSGNSVTAETVFKNIQCNNCGRNVNYEVTVPRNTKQVLVNKFGDIQMNNSVTPLDVNLQFGKLYANELSDANLAIQYGGATINKCGNLKIKSGFSKYELGVIGAMTGTISHDGFKIDELGNADFKSEFTNVDISKLKQSFNAEKFSYGSLKIGQVDNNFSKIKVDASFTKVNVGLTNNHNFKTTLHSSFGSINTGNVIFLEKSLDKKDVVVGIAGKLKDPSATVDISNSHGNIVF